MFRNVDEDCRLKCIRGIWIAPLAFRQNFIEQQSWNTHCSVWERGDEGSKVRGTMIAVNVTVMRQIDDIRLNFGENVSDRIRDEIPWCNIQRRCRKIMKLHRSDAK